MAAAAGKKEHDFVVLVHGSLWPGSGRGALYYGHADLGRRDVDWQMVHRTQRSLNASGS